MPAKKSAADRLKEINTAHEERTKRLKLQADAERIRGELAKLKGTKKKK